MVAVATPSTPVTDPLSLAALDTERHVAAAGWDQNPRLFALVDTAALIEAEPSIRADLTATDLLPGALTAVEQEGLLPTSDLESLLGRIEWPETVLGCAIAVERVVVPPAAERDLPSDPQRAVDALAGHPDRQDVRLLVAVTRAGGSICLLRQRAHDSDDRVASGTDIAPGLVHALRATLDT
ncbi:MAG: PPA1309 family protein [Nostocoides sp.]